MSPDLIYLTAVLAGFGPTWTVIYVIGKDQRREVLELGLGIGALSVVTCYFWWTQDWWLPQTITGTLVGLEDFLIGFFAGGVMTAGYEVLRRWHDKVEPKLFVIGRQQAMILLLLLAFIVSFLFWGLGVSSALACFVALIFGIGYTVKARHDLWHIAIGSGFVTLIASIPFYLFLVLLAPDWVESTYQFKVLTGFRILNVPIEEFVFWFLAGMVFGPFYELMKGLKETK